MNRLLTLTLSLACLAACEGNELPPVPSPSPAFSAVPLTVAASDNAASAKPSATPGASPAPKTSPSPTPKPSPSPKPSPTPINGPVLTYDTLAFKFDYAADWGITRNEKSPLVLELTSPGGGTGVFSVIEEKVPGAPDIEVRRQSVVKDVGPGLISNEMVKLDFLNGYQIIANKSLDKGSRFYTYRGYIYRLTYFRLTTYFDRNAADAAKVEKDLAAMIKSWRWQ